MPLQDPVSPTLEGAGESLRRTVAEAWGRLRARAREEGMPRYLALRVRVPTRDPLDAFLETEDADRTYWTHPAAGLARAAHGEAWSLEVEAGGELDRFDVAARGVADVLARLEVIGDEAPPEAGPVVDAGFAYADRGLAAAGARRSPPRGGAAADDGDWRSFPAARLVLAERQLARVGDATFECRVARVAPDAPEEGWAGLFREHGAVHEHADGRAGARSGEGALPLDGREPERGIAPAYTVEADRPHEAYEAGVRDALAEIARGGLEKVVLARALDVRHEGRFGLRQFVEQLRAAYPDCATFVVARGCDLFVSASPERLVGVDGDAIRTAALAGSAPRGRSPEEDARLGQALLASSKDLAEHEAVRRTIVSTLRAEARDVQAADTPRLRRLAGIQHLESPIDARLRADAGRPGEAILRLVAALHPTPAVGGLPAAAADAWLAEHEHLDRGWYAAPVGWIAADGSGEFRVALRSARLRCERAADGALRSTARLYAGAGIVEGSEPHAELVETRIKLRALLAPLTEI